MGNIARDAGKSIERDHFIRNTEALLDKRELSTPVPPEIQSGTFPTREEVGSECVCARGWKGGGWHLDQIRRDVDKAVTVDGEERFKWEDVLFDWNRHILFLCESFL